MAFWSVNRPGWPFSEKEAVMATWPETPEEYARQAEIEKYVTETAEETTLRLQWDLVLDPCPWTNQKDYFEAVKFALKLERDYHRGQMEASSKPEPLAQPKAQQEGRASFALGLATGLGVGGYVALFVWLGSLV